MSSPERHLITAALPYANGPVHIGHMAGNFLPADTYARYLRNAGKEVLFVCGTDEHGVAVTLKAKKTGQTPQEVVDYYHADIKNSLDLFGMSFDVFSRTTKDIHHETARDFFSHLAEKGSFIEKETDQFYDAEAQQFLADRYIQGKCPNCGNPGAFGDQCESCGTSLSPDELIDPVSSLTGNKPVKKKTTNWFLPLDKIQEDFLDDWIASKDYWKPSVHGQCKSWLKLGLKPRAMTRDLDWGVKVPLPNAEGKVMYVWFDAPIGYISATKEIKGDNWKDWWQNESTELTHFLGKDNIVFHCLIFPSMLHLHGDYILPTHVPANEFLNLEGQKISTSRNHAIWLSEYLQDFPDRKDELRYVLTAISPESKDSDFTWADYQARVNNELVAVLGNFVNRVVVLSGKYFDGIIQANENPTENDAQVLEEINQYEKEFHRLINAFKFREAQFELMNIARAGNKYITVEEPWKSFKQDPKRAGEVLHVCAQVIAKFAELSGCLLPETTDKLNQILPQGANAGESVVTIGHLFTPITDEEMEAQREKLTPEEPPMEVNRKDDINFEDFMKLELRNGTIVQAEKVKGADKLLQIEVDLGFEKRTIVSGIAQHFSPEEIVGKNVSVVVNLAPKKLRGVMSQGMILMAESEGKLHFVSSEGEVPPGAEIR